MTRRDKLKPEWTMLPTLDQLVMFLATVQHGDAAKAQKALGLRSPAVVSTNNRKTEKELGLQLFHPNSSRPTKAGLDLVKYAKRVVNTHKYMRQQMAKYEQDHFLQNRISIVCQSWIHIAFWGDLNASLRQIDQNYFVRKITTKGTEVEVLQNFILGKHTFMLSTNSYSGYDCVEIFRLPLVPIQSSMDQDMLRHKPLRVIGYSENTANHRAVETAINGQDAMFIANMETPSEIKYAVAGGAGIGFIPSKFITPEVKQIENSDFLPVDMVFYAISTGQKPYTG